jgi:hypothetical protein
LEHEKLNQENGMNDDHRIAGQEHQPGMTGAGAVQEAPEEAIPFPAATRVPGIGSRWPKVLFGRLVLRVCPSGKQVCRHKNCHLRAFCKCAQAEWRAAGVMENRFWAVLAACAAALILYSFLRA